MELGGKAQSLFDGVNRSTKSAAGEVHDTAIIAFCEHDQALNLNRLFCHQGDDGVNANLGWLVFFWVKIQPFVLKLFLEQTGGRIEGSDRLQCCCPARASKDYNFGWVEWDKGNLASSKDTFRNLNCFPARWLQWGEGGVRVVQYANTLLGFLILEANSVDFVPEGTGTG